MYQFVKKNYKQPFRFYFELDELDMFGYVVLAVTLSARPISDNSKSFISNSPKNVKQALRNDLLSVVN